MSKMNPNHASSSVGILAHAFTSPIHSTVSCPDLRILHFNDVYNVAGFAKEPVGGIARFESLVNHYRDGMHFREQPKLLTLFSGDCLNPSLESIFTKGRHMVEALNRIGVEFACLGNHELDFGMAHFEHMAKDCNFPWLVANMLDPALGENVSLGHCQKTAIVVSNGIKIGLIGLAEREWLPAVYQLPPNVIYKSASATALELIPELKKQGADLIIALTHQREPNDVKLAENTSGLIDLILAGHDHFYKHHIVNGTHIVRSGYDFKQLSYLELRRASVPSQRPWEIRVIREDITGSVPEDPIAAEWTKSLASSLRPQMEQPVGCTSVEIDARVTSVRTKESNMGNFVTDLMRSYYRSDCSLMAAGTIRGDQVYQPGLLTIKDIRECYPFDDPCVVLSLTGAAISEALENAVSLYPALEPRFPQLSNISFVLNSSRPPKSRLTDIRIGNQALDPAKLYRLTTTDYIARGKLDFKSLMGTPFGGTAELLVAADEGLEIYELILRYFLAPEEFAGADGIEPLDWNVTTVLPSSSSTSTSHGLTTPSSESSHPSEAEVEEEAEMGAGPEAHSLSSPAPAKDASEVLGPCLSSTSSEEATTEEKEDEGKNLRWISPKVDGRIQIL